jgi:hypothetical protein
MTLPTSMRVLISVSAVPIGETLLSSRNVIQCNHSWCQSPSLLVDYSVLTLDFWIEETSSHVIRYASELFIFFVRKNYS